ncbi:hypothetical protein [Alkaliflexus imshenetskii]|uniref:hypothetical protein n=1 Tax=Alkaliflexus imshenetskii TaxID=286730 RepID=UPI0012FC3B4C|nr:hypothetical protein [Alkaliflexus imshenetskii]
MCLRQGYQITCIIGCLANRHKDGVNFSLGLDYGTGEATQLMLREKAHNPLEEKAKSTNAAELVADGA